MAQFKYIGHLNGITTPPSGLIHIKGVKKQGDPDLADEFEMDVTPGVTFEILDTWTTAVQALENTRHPFNPAIYLYERIS